MKHIKIRRSIGVMLLSFLLGGMANAGPCEPTGSVPRFSFAFNRTFTSPDDNAAGALYPNAHRWELGDTYVARCACAGAETPFKVFYTTRTELPKGERRTVNGVPLQFYVLNRNLQVGVEVFLAGEVRQYKAVPWDSLSNEMTGQRRCRNGESIDSRPFETGSRGRVHLLISRPFVGTLNVPEFKVLDVFGVQGYATAPGSVPMVSLFMSMGVTVPQNCKLAAGQQTTIDFGPLIAGQLARPGAARQSAVSRTFQIQCTNISAGVKINLALEGRPHGRDARYLETTHQNVAVAMESAGKLVPPSLPGGTPAGGQLIPIALDYDNLRALFGLTAWPVKMVENPTPGGFQGSATLKFDFE